MIIKLLSLSLSRIFNIDGRLHSACLLCSSASSTLLLDSSFIYYLDFYWLMHAFDCTSSFTSSRLYGAKCIYWKLIIFVGPATHGCYLNRDIFIISRFSGFLMPYYLFGNGLLLTHGRYFSLSPLNPCSAHCGHVIQHSLILVCIHMKWLKSTNNHLPLYQFVWPPPTCFPHIALIWGITGAIHNNYKEIDKYHYCFFTALSLSLRKAYEF